MQMTLAEVPAYAQGSLGVLGTRPLLEGTECSRWLGEFRSNT